MASREKRSGSGPDSILVVRVTGLIDVYVELTGSVTDSRKNFEEFGLRFCSAQEVLQKSKLVSF